MSVDWSGIRAALASNAASVGGILESTSTALSQVVQTPCVKVTHISDVRMLDRGAGYEYREATVRGHLLVARNPDLSTAMVNVETIAEGLSVAYRTGFALGYVAVVQDSWLDAWEAGSFEYAGVDYGGAALTWKVRVREPVTRSTS